jgi:hypothetical protein
MGRQHRLTQLSYTSGILTITLLASGGCSHVSSEESARRAEARRTLLRGENFEQQRIAHLEKTRLTTYQGDLLPSDTQVAGLVIPRGFTMKYELDHEWYYDGELPVAKLEKYLHERVTSVAVERPDRFSVVFAQAVDKSAPKMDPLLIKIFPVPGRSDWSRMDIRAPKPMPDHILSEDEIRMRLAAKRQNE